MGVVFLATDKSSVKGSISKGFRSPQLNELFMFPAANPDLKPERLWNYEIGFEQKFSQNLTLEMTFFLMEGSNLVEQRSNAAPPPLFQFQNIGTYNFWGTEISVRADVLPNLTGHVFYSYLDPGEHTRGRPGHKLDCLLQFAGGPFRVSLNGQYVGNYFADDQHSNPLPSYILMSSRLKFDVSPAVELFLDINNILNEDYMIFVELPGIASGIYPQPGRNLLLGIRFKK
jgi:iron complex outermembrane receptor protein